MQNIETNIKEIFTSIQGEGPYVGQKHIFVRMCKCNLCCKYCDTDFSISNSKKFNSKELFEKLKNINCDTISFTGGEPLCDVDFLYDFLSKYKKILNKQIYLETNGTLYQNLQKIIDYTDIISMDIKLFSSTNQENQFENNKKFLETAKNKETFIKVVFTNKITNEEITSCCNIANKNNNLIILQPKMPMEKDIKLEEIFEKFYTQHKNTRLIPQTHKFLNLA